MANTLVPPPQQFVIHVTKGCDLAFTLNRKDSLGALADWDATVSLYIGDTSYPATVTDSAAVFQVESSVTDTLTDRSTWRVVMSQAGSPSLEIAVAVGKFKRVDS